MSPSTSFRSQNAILSSTSAINTFASTGPIEPRDSDDSGTESDFEMLEYFRADPQQVPLKSSIPKDTFSLTDSIQEHVLIDGRRYHAKSAGKYYLPSDEAEQNRLDKAHHLQLSRLSGALCMAPLPRDSDPKHVLDCGTGTGIWALDFGELHPRSEVIGVDLAPIQPTWTYTNVIFEVDDLEEDWTFPSDHFDFIHSRGVGLGIKNWQRYAEQMFKHCAPGGYVEISESELSPSLSSTTDDPTLIPATSPITKFLTLASLGHERAGIPITSFCGEFFESHLSAAGFTDIEVYTFAIPWGNWVGVGDMEVGDGVKRGEEEEGPEKMRKIGEAAVEVVAGGCEAVGLGVMTQVLEMGEEEARRVCREAEEDIRGGKEKRYHWHWQVVGRKPGGRK